MALLPMLWLGLLHAGGRRIGLLWWVLAGTFLVSWGADTAAHWLSWQDGSSLYPIAQAALFGAALLTREEWRRFSWWFGGAALIDLWLTGLGGPNLFVRTLAWGALLVIVWRHSEAQPLRFSVAVSFGLGWLGWIACLIAPSWPTWGTYQGIRALGIGVFCWASLKVPHRAHAST